MSEAQREAQREAHLPAAIERLEEECVLIEEYCSALVLKLQILPAPIEVPKLGEERPEQSLIEERAGQIRTLCNRLSASVEMLKLANEAVEDI